MGSPTPMDCGFFFEEKKPSLLGTSPAIHEKTHTSQHPLVLTRWRILDTPSLTGNLKKWARLHVGGHAA
jgi:hypothetical protein